MTPSSISSQALLDSLRRAVTHALQRKRMLGQYAVVWRQGRPEVLNGHQLPAPEAGIPMVRENPPPYAPRPTQGA